ncbi:MAG: HDOD domain-containing protein [bacterium]|nr:HDOD domain-containing protein [bacterium]
MPNAAHVFVEHARDLPVMPPVAAEVLRQVEDPDTDINNLAELITRDAGLAMQVLKLANSSLYSMPREIETLPQAIVLLGYSTLRSVVIAASLKDVFANFGPTERLLWNHASAGGITASSLAEQVTGLRKEEAFLGGLLHDIGKLAIIAKRSDAYQAVVLAVEAGESDAISAEREAFDFDHAQVGGLLLDKWGVSERLAQAVSAHHDPESAPEEARPLAALIQIADILCHTLGYGRPEPAKGLPILSCAGAHILGLQDADPEELIASTKKAYEDGQEVFS